MRAEASTPLVQSSQLAWIQQVRAKDQQTRRFRPSTRDVQRPSSCAFMRNLYELSMLKLDSSTSNIPVFTCLATPEGTRFGADPEADRSAFHQSLPYR
jgi:hypothetical protein